VNVECILSLWIDSERAIISKQLGNKSRFQAMSEKIALNRTLLPGLGCRFSPRNASIIKILLPGCASIRSSLYRRNAFDLPAAASSRLAILFVALSNLCKNSNPLRSWSRNFAGNKETSCSTKTFLRFALKNACPVIKIRDSCQYNLVFPLF
jgi:hypothetical protein